MKTAFYLALTGKWPEIVLQKNSKLRIPIKFWSCQGEKLPFTLTEILLK